MKTHLLFLIAVLALVAESRGNTIVSVQFGGAGGTANFIAYTGVEPDAAAADFNFNSSNQWNYVRETFTGVGAFSFPLLTSINTDPGTKFFTTADGGENLGANLPTEDIFINDPALSPSTFSITGLTPNAKFAMFIYGQDYSHNGLNISSNIQVGTASFLSATASKSSESPDFGRDGLIMGVTSSSGSIQGTWANGATITNPKTWAGFQIDVASTPEPATYVSLGGGLVLLASLRRRRMCMLNSPRDHGASR